MCVCAQLHNPLNGEVDREIIFTKIILNNFVGKTCARYTGHHGATTGYSDGTKSFSCRRTVSALVPTYLSATLSITAKSRHFWVDEKIKVRVCNMLL